MATKDKQKQTSEEITLLKLQYQIHELIERNLLLQVKQSMPIQIARAIIYAWIDLNALQHTDMQHWYNSWDFSKMNQASMEKIIAALKKTEFVEMAAYVEDVMRKLLYPFKPTATTVAPRYAASTSSSIYKVDDPVFWYEYLRFELYGRNKVLLQTNAAKKTQDLIMQYLLTKMELLSKELGFNPVYDGWFIDFLNQFFLSKPKEQTIQYFIEGYFDYISQKFTLRTTSTILTTISVAGSSASQPQDYVQLKNIYAIQS